MQRAGLAGLALWMLASAAHAETAMFVVPNAPDAYGVDECLARGARCGAAVANAFCQSRQFAQAASFRRVEPAEVTGAVRSISTGRALSAYVGIECAR